MKHDCAMTIRLPRWGWAALVVLLAALPAHAQYKVISADGKVTYTDRPPAAGKDKVTTISSRGVGGGAVDVTLPLELRQPVARYPVTLYTVTGTCGPCETARQLLRQRGVPYAEKQVQTPEDSEALERLSGARDAPTLAIGTQMMRGFAPEVWGSYLDAAGYPRESRLPANYQYAAATPIVERREASAARPAASAAAPDATVAPPASPTGIKF
ncbi:MAG TPA: glutaredoxin family protein [Burkholderiaceae bacterium]|nr:glutaredoxin family protein [Burkholderiaceae bacterium]